MKLEIGCGQRPTPGYIHNDLNNFPGVELVCSPWEVTLESNTLEEVLALGVIEHLTYDQVEKTFNNIFRMLKPGGVFLFDVPDIPIWCQYVVDYFAGKETPFEIDHIFATLYGWQRWPGDEHKSGWYKEKLEKYLVASGFTTWEEGVNEMKSRGHERNRMNRPTDAHIYVAARR
ncbi:unannotated protein [freshwater metagenome]|uniref:Unannotated protein n=1 Tax=freshwater metagenome TaxID=449393 RepID=A0A6J7I434_9ZZZZ|nr:methyltransferase domain-containing protein [Actinomycetota bacterium]